MIHKRRLAGLLAAVTAVGVVAPPGVAAAIPGGGPATAGLASAGPNVTLLTGDKVTLGGPNGVSVRPAAGREAVPFRAHTDEQGDWHVIPEDALTLVSSGRLDQRLFDVTELARDGYDDTSRADLPLIVDYPGATPRIAGAEVAVELPAISATAVLAQKSGAFWASARTAAQRIWLDGRVRASLDHSVPQIGAPAAWEAGHTGAGTTVAVLDTGVDKTHPDLDDAVTGEQNFTDAETVTDKFGHGTHVASIVTGAGAKYRGVAPDAKLLNGKVLDDNGGGLESWIIAGMEWAAGNGADVINMSLGSSFPSDGTDPMSQAVNRITAETGALFVIAAGNSGGAPGSPGAADAALTVGAVDREDKLAGFSSRGPRWGDEAIKPDITAPGVDIAAAKAADGQIGDPVEDGYVRLSGTSMATPHVAGAAAILAGQHPDWHADQLKSSLMGSAKPGDGQSVFEQGAGRVDVAAAVKSPVVSSPASISTGIVQWPHDDDEPIAKTVSYTNTGTEPVTLGLAVDVKGADGSTAPEDMFTVEPSRLTVPAGGQASATLTTNTKVEATDQVYGGLLTATGGDTVVRTPIAVTREVESYNVTLNFLNHDGAPTDQYWFRFVDVNKPKAVVPLAPSSTFVARVAKGEHYFESWVQTQRGEFEFEYTDIVEPALTVAGDIELTMDARDGKPVGFTVDRPNAKVGQAVLSYARKTAWGATGLTAFLSNFDGQYVRPSKTSAAEQFTFTAEAHLGEPDGTGEWPGFAGSPYLYHVRTSNPGVVPATLRWRFTDRQLAKVRSTHAVAAPGTSGLRDNMVTAPLPFSLTEFYTPDVPWNTFFAEFTGDPGNAGSVQFVIEPRTYRKGKTAKERWNVGVFSPALPYNRFATWYYAARLGDDMRFSLPLFTPTPGMEGWSPADGGLTLLRNGEQIGASEFPDSGLFAVPAGDATYTVRTSADRSATHPLSTKVNAEWTFKSDTVAGEEPQALSLLAVRFAPELSDHNTAPAGKRFSFPVYMQRNGSPDPGRVETPRVEVSYDDGASWQPVKLKRDRGKWVASVNHPKGAQFVSLRSSVSDGDTSASQTVLRAYALK